MVWNQKKVIIFVLLVKKNCCFCFRTRRIWQYKIGNGLSCSGMGWMCCGSREIFGDHGRFRRERSSQAEATFSFAKFPPRSSSFHRTSTSANSNVNLDLDRHQLRPTKFCIDWNASGYREYASPFGRYHPGMGTISGPISSTTTRKTL